MKAVLASHNKKKIVELERLLKLRIPNITLVSPEEVGIVGEAVETGMTFEENAILKAEYCAVDGYYSFADDSGLVVDALDGQPGVYSARYGGDGLDDAGRTDLLLKNMEGITNRAAAFECAISMVYPDGKVITASGRCEGNIALAPSTRVGFGYDPVFIPNGYNVTFSELTMDEKNSISHRGRALAELKKKLNGES